ncbi:MAG: hypothetical protein JW837_06870 [Sedimentisphaerales bacterium]|nr:hypothetical protein [Sedimentisphaerales bacterium]
MHPKEEWAVLDLNKNSQTKSTKELNNNTNSKGVHNPVHNIEVCRELQEIINAWPTLPDHIKSVIITLVKTPDENKK